MVTTIVPCKECHEYPCTCEEEETKMSEMFVEPNYIIECKCGAKLKIYNVWYEDWGKVKRIYVERHTCSYPVLDVEEYYKDEGEQLGHNDTY